MNKRRKELDQLDKASLIEGYILLEKRVRSLEKQVRDMQQLIQDMAAAAPIKTPENSSIPSGQTRKAKREEKPRAKRGPKKGHEGKSRNRQEPDERLECRVGTCEVCGEDLSKLVQHEVGRHQVIDIPPMRPIVREVVRYGRYCPQCQTYHRAPAPEGFEAGRVFGAHLEQLVVYLHYAHPLSYERVQSILNEMCGIKVSLGALVNIVRRNTEAMQGAAQDIVKQIQQATVIGSDETGARVAGDNHWQWVFQTPLWVYTIIRPTRRGAEIEAVLEDAKPEVWVSDLFSSQLHHPAEILQVCLSHQIRDLQYAIDADSCSWAAAVQALLRESIHLGNQRDVLGDVVFRQQVDAIEKQMDDWLTIYPDFEDSQRLWRRYRKHRQHLFVFLHRDDVPPTNNASEQALRNSVIYRKVTGGFRTEWGADIYGDVISILESARRQGLHLFDTLAAILAGQPVFSRVDE